MIDWITGEKFKTVGDFIFGASASTRSKDDYDGLENTLKIPLLKNFDIIYTHTIYAQRLFAVLSVIDEKVTVVTHNADVNVDDKIKIPDNVIKWHTQNVNTQNPKVESIPIGLENERWFKPIHKKEKMEAMLRTPKHRRNLVYMNHNVKTNPSERTKPYQVLENKSWVTTDVGVNGRGFESYLANVYSHKFVICPVGNGMDTHRTWETLYMGSVPIEKRNLNNRFYTDLPICFVDDWEEVTERYLEKWIIDNVEKNWNMSKLDFSYWKNKIRNGKDKN